MRAPLDPRVKLRLTALTTIALALILAVLANALLSDLETRKGLTLDLSRDGTTLLSDDTRAVVASIEEDVYIHLLAESGSGDGDLQRLKTLLNRYRALNSRVHVDTIDPLRDPSRVNRYRSGDQVLSEGSLIVANADESRVRVLPALEMYDYEYDSASGAYAISAFNGESLLTGALVYVQSEDAPLLTILSGHNEITVDYLTTLSERLRLMNIDVVSAGALEADLSPGNAVAVIAPAIDLTQEEYQALESFALAGGSLLFLNDPAVNMQALPRFADLLSLYGLSFEEGYVSEDPSATDRYMSNILYLIPLVNREQIIGEGLPTQCRLILPECRAVSALEDSGDIRTEALLTTSDKAELCADQTEVPGDDAIEGTFSLAMASQNGVTGGRAVAAGNIYLAVDTGYLTSTHNLRWTLQAIRWLIPQEGGVSIEPRSVADDALMIPDAAAFWRISLAVLFLPPLIAAGIGLAVWLRRRRL